MAIDPNIALQAQAPDPMGQVGKLLGMAQGVQNLQASRFKLNQEQFSALSDNFNAMARDPLIADAAKEKDPIKRREIGKQILDKLLTHADFAVQSGVPPQMVEHALGPYITTATLHPENLQQLIAQRQSASIGALSQVGQAQVAAGGQQTMQFDPTTNKPVIVTKDQFGQIISITPTAAGQQNVPTYQEPPPPITAKQPTAKTLPTETTPANKPSGGGGAFRSPEDLERIKKAQTDIDQIRTSAGMIPQTKQSIGQVLKLLDTDTKFGKGSKQWNDAMAYLHTLTGGKIGDNSTNYQEANAYIDRLIAQQAQASGNQSVAAQNLTAGATGNVDTMNPEALKEKMRNLRGLLAGNEAYRKGLDFYVGTGERQTPARKAEFDAKFSDAWDTDLFRLKEAADNKDTEEMQKIAAKYSSSELQEKMKKLNKVVPGYIPKDWIKSK